MFNIKLSDGQINFLNKQKEECIKVAQEKALSHINNPKFYSQAEEDIKFQVKKFDKATLDQVSSGDFEGIDLKSFVQMFYDRYFEKAACQMPIDLLVINGLESIASDIEVRLNKLILEQTLEVIEGWLRPNMISFACEELGKTKVSTPETQVPNLAKANVYKEIAKVVGNFIYDMSTVSKHRLVSAYESAYKAGEDSVPGNVLDQDFAKENLKILIQEKPELAAAQLLTDEEVFGSTFAQSLYEDCFVCGVGAALNDYQIDGLDTDYIKYTLVTAYANGVRDTINKLAINAIEQLKSAKPNEVDYYTNRFDFVK